MKRALLTFATLSLLAVVTVGKAAPKSITITQEVSQDATPTLYSILMDESADGKVIKFEKGTYNFYPEKAHEQFCHISNHNDVLARIGFPILDCDGVTIDGGGSKFIFHGRMIPFWIERSEEVTIKNLTIDFAETFHSEGTVVAIDENAGTFDLKYRDEDVYEIRNGQIFFIKPYYSFNLGQTLYFDPARNAPAYKAINYGVQAARKAELAKPFDNADYKYGGDSNNPYIIDRARENALVAQEIAPQTVRFSGANKKKLPITGLVLVAKGERGPNRFAPAVRGRDCVDLKFESVITNHAGGMGYIFDNCENVDIYKCRVEPSAGRIISATADATHFVGCRGLVALRDSEFHNQMDDAMNVHGTYQQVMDILDENTIGVRAGHFQQLGYQMARPGDTVGFVRLHESFDPYAKLTVKSINSVNGRYHRVTFIESLPKDLKVYDLVENISAYPEVLVENCRISRNRARGLLISTPVKTTIRNNYFSTDMSAVLLPVEDSFWYESGSAANVLIENNVFQDCVTSGKSAAVISFATDGGNEKTAFRDITIKNNKFNHYDNNILNITNVDGLRFEGNTIINSETFPQLNPESAAINVSYSQNLIFKGNIYKGKAPQIIKCSEDMKPIKFK
ncbi:MAG: right-handed parallel beta-helix repeat-containing protein [Rikenellaceae bacterium]